MAIDILPALLHQWSSAKVEFTSPKIITDKTICDKIVTLWNEASAIAYPRKKGATNKY